VELFENCQTSSSNSSLPPDKKENGVNVVKSESGLATDLLIVQPTFCGDEGIIVAKGNVFLLL
jgi:hypothetical protein